MHVEYLLEGGLPVGEKQVHSPTRQAGAAQRPRQAVASPEQAGAQFFIESFQAVRMNAGDHQHVPLRQRSDIHEGNDVLVFVGKARLCTPSDDLAECARCFRRPREWSSLIARFG